MPSFTVHGVRVLGRLPAVQRRAVEQRVPSRLLGRRRARRPTRPPSRRPRGPARRSIAACVVTPWRAKLSGVRQTGHTSACYSSALTRGGSMRIVRTAALGAAVVMAAGVAVATQTATNRTGLLMKSALFTWESVPENADRARRPARRLRGADGDARRARVPHDHAQAGRLAARAAHPQERRADHRQGRRGRGLRQRRVEAGADRVA